LFWTNGFESPTVLCAKLRHCWPSLAVTTGVIHVAGLHGVLETSAALHREVLTFTLSVEAYSNRATLVHFYKAQHTRRHQQLSAPDPQGFGTIRFLSPKIRVLLRLPSAWPQRSSCRRRLPKVVKAPVPKGGRFRRKGT